MSALPDNIVLLGNVAPVEAVKVDEKSAEVEKRSIRRRLGITAADKDGPDGTITTFNTVPSDSMIEKLMSVTAAFDGYHSDDPPEWVEAGDPVLQRAIAQHYHCAEGRPKGWRAYGEEE